MHNSECWTATLTVSITKMKQGSWQILRSGSRRSFVSKTKKMLEGYQWVDSRQITLSIFLVQIAILARQIKQNVTGVITLNGVPAKASAVRRHSTYVPQMDVLLATATVWHTQTWAFKLSRRMDYLCACLSVLNYHDICGLLHQAAQWSWEITSLFKFSACA